MLQTVWRPQVVPMENPRGRERVEAGEVCLRTNGRDVDINRNWGVHWGHKEADYDPREEYPGTAPFRCDHTPCLQASSLECSGSMWWKQGEGCAGDGGVAVVAAAAVAVATLHIAQSCWRLERAFACGFVRVVLRWV